MKQLLNRVSGVFTMLALAAFAQAIELEDLQPWAIGEAWSSDGGTLLYREYHFAEDPSLDLPTRILYLDPEGQLFAEKSLSYHQSLNAPAVSYIDHRSQAQVEVAHNGDSRARMVRVAFRADEDSRKRSRDIDLSDTLIIDAGFDPFIRQHWDALVNGNRITAPFLVPSRLDTIRVGVTNTRRSDCAIDGEDILCFTVRPAGMLRVVGWLVDPIYLAYDSQTQRLLMFDGVSNIPDDAGDNQTVRLLYYYPADSLDSAS